MSALDAYRRDGFVVADNVYSTAEVRHWKAVLREVLERERREAGPARATGETGVRLWNAQTLHPVILAAMRKDRLLAVLRQLVGPKLEFLSAKLVYKSAATNFASPWHQDWFYWEGAPKTSVWIALDDATVANGCLRFVPGSQARTFPKTVVGGRSFANQVRDEELAGLSVESVEVRAGSAVFFSDLAVHSSHPNAAGTDRWSLISTYRDATVPDGSRLNAELWKQPLRL